MWAWHARRFAERHRRLLNALLRQNASLLEHNLAPLLRAPRLIDFDNKRAHFRARVRASGEDRAFGTLRICVRREHVFEDSFHQLRMRCAWAFSHVFEAIVRKQLEPSCDPVETAPRGTLRLCVCCELVFGDSLHQLRMPCALHPAAAHTLLRAIGVCLLIVWPCMPMHVKHRCIHILRVSVK